MPHEPLRRLMLTRILRESPGRAHRNLKAYGVVRKSGLIALPVDMTGYRPGQRLYFQATVHGLVLEAKATRAVNGRLLSCRLRRAVRSIALYGPRRALA